MAMPAVKPIRARGRLVVVVVLLHDDGRRRGLGVDDLRVVLRHVHHLRVRRLDDDHLLAALDGPRLDGLLGRALQVAGRLALLPQPLDAVEHRPAIDGEGPAQLRGPGQVAGHEVDHLREGRQRDEAGLEARLLRGLLQLAALARRLLQPRAELTDLPRVAGAQQHLREQLVGVERDRGEQLVQVGGVERPAALRGPRHPRRARPPGAGRHHGGDEHPDSDEHPPPAHGPPPRRYALTPGSFFHLARPVSIGPRSHGGDSPERTRSNPTTREGERVWDAGGNHAQDRTDGRASVHSEGAIAHARPDVYAGGTAHPLPSVVRCGERRKRKVLTLRWVYWCNHGVSEVDQWPVPNLETSPVR